MFVLKTDLKQENDKIESILNATLNKVRETTLSIHDDDLSLLSFSYCYCSANINNNSNVNSRRSSYFDRNCNNCNHNYNNNQNNNKDRVQNDELEQNQQQNNQNQNYLEDQNIGNDNHIIECTIKKENIISKSPLDIQNEKEALKEEDEKDLESENTNIINNIDNTNIHQITLIRHKF